MKTTSLLGLALLLSACGTAETRASGDAGATDVAAPQDVSRVDGAPTPSDVAAGDAVTAISDAAVNACNPLAVTGDCLPPFPSDLLTRADPSTPTGRRLALPDDGLVAPPGTRAIEMAPFNRADGWPPTMPAVVHLGVALRPADLAGVRETDRTARQDFPIRLIEVETGRLLSFVAEMDANARDPSRAALIVRPLSHVRFGARYALVITTAARAADGSALPVSRGFAAIRDNTPTSDPRIEAARARYEPVFTALGRAGVPRDQVHLALEWTTASRRHVLGPILGMREEVFRRAAMPGGIPFTITRVIEAPNRNVARMVFGTFTPPNYLREDSSVGFNADGTATLQPTPISYPFTMIVPARAMTATEPLPLTIFGHGVFGRGEEYLNGNIGRDLIQPLAQELGSVVLATDWIGLSGGDLQMLIQEVVPNINRVTLVTDRLLQSLVNNLALTELGVGALTRDPRVRPGAVDLVNPAQVYYYGVSLGGIQGTSLYSVSRHISRAVAAVPGGSWSNLLPRSTVYGPIKTFIDVRYPDPLLQTQFISLLQGRFDHTDGVNLGSLVVRDPLPDAPRSRRLILQEAIGDCQVPNLSTRILAAALGAQQFMPNVELVYGLPTTASPSDASAVLSQFALPDHLRRYTPPDTNTIPTMDNGTHSDSVSAMAAMAQLRELMRTGSIVQPCMGACDPD